MTWIGITLLAAGASLPAPEGNELVRVHEVVAREGEEILGSWAVASASGGLDLVLVTIPAEGGRRRLSVRRGEEGYARDASQEIELTPDVIAAAPGDVHADPGDEIVLWSASGIFAWRPLAPSEESPFLRLGSTDLLWQRADARGLVWWAHGVHDLDGDGRDDLVSPAARGFQVHLQRTRAEGGGEEFLAMPFLDLDPAELVIDGRREIRTHDGAQGEAAGRGGFSFGRDGSGSFQLSFGSQGTRVAEFGATLLDHSARMPAPMFADFDGDGTPEILAQTARELHVYDGWDVGGAPAASLPLPLEIDRSRRLDLSHAAAVGDLDADGRADVMILAGDKRSAAIRTQVLIYRAAAVPRSAPPVFGADGTPSQLLVLSGFSGRVDVEDLNGDGLDDLAVASLRPDILSALGGGDALEVEVFAFLSERGTFPRQANLATRVALPAGRLRNGYAFVKDVGGDGVRDLLVAGENEVALYLVRPARGGEGLERLDRAVWSLGLGEDVGVELQRGRHGTHAILREPRRVRLLEVAP